MKEQDNNEKNQNNKDLILNSISHVFCCIKNTVLFIVNIIIRISLYIKKIFNKMKLINRNNLKTVVTKIIIIILLLLIGFIILYIYIYVARRTMIVTDDFDHYNTINDIPNYIEGKNLHNAIEYAKWDCLNLGGRYFTMFIQCYFGLKKGIDYISNQAIIMTCNVLLYFFSIVYVVLSIVHNFIIERKQVLNQIIISLFISLSFIIAFNCFNYYPQIFNWFPGATSYSIPLSCFLISLGSMIYLINYDNLFFTLLSFVFGIFSMGGSLCIVTTSITILGIVFLMILVSNKMNYKFFVLTINILIFGIINFISPGNYNRRNITIGNDYTIVDILNTSSSYINARFKTIFFNPFALIVILIISGFIAYMILKYFKVSFSLFIIYPLFVLLPFATTIPVSAGFGNLTLYNQKFVYDRICFAIDFSLMITIIVLFVLLYLSIIYITKNMKKHIVVLCVMSIFCFIALYKYKDYLFFSDIHIIEITDNIIQKKYDKAYDEYLAMMKDLEAHRGQKFVTVKKPKTVITHYYNFEQRKYENEFFEIENLTIK